ncbi:hypothetical protein PAPYR_13122 [Paratrimastix pyriformis]|uniref:Uncharacterized protein n=1 Tax=Paratrimastix pyriformis TaxID=342808 RepID=A0ABQ8U0S6_9EUKA|nr:hypothetical protein PAPYR_13122 [Paratrimastix pyriformis]
MSLTLSSPFPAQTPPVQVMVMDTESRPRRSQPGSAAPASLRPPAKQLVGRQQTLRSAHLRVAVGPLRQHWMSSRALGSMLPPPPMEPPQQPEVEAQPLSQRRVVPDNFLLPFLDQGPRVFDQTHSEMED